MSATKLGVAPVGSGERSDLIDILRGFALLGILVVNFWGDEGELIPQIDQIVDQALIILVSASFYPLFSFLFGLGFAIQLIRARERQKGAVWHLYLRRLLVLFLIGSAHAVLIWRGDILTDYTIVGLLLIPFALLPLRAVLVSILLLFTVQLYTPDRFRQVITGNSSQELVRADELVQGVRDEQVRIERTIALRDGRGAGSGPAFDLSERWRAYGNKLVGFADPWTFVRIDILMLFLVGLYVGRKGWIQKAAEHRKGFLITAGVGAGAALAANLLPLAVGDFEGVWARPASAAANYGPTAFYIAAITLLFTRRAGAGRFLRSFIPAGRMGLTNYLMQSLVMTWLFYSYGAGFQQPSTTFWLLLNVTFFFALQVPLSHWWMNRFHFGPAEWLWRSLTYAAAQPFRRRPTIRLPEELVVVGLDRDAPRETVTY